MKLKLIAIVLLMGGAAFAQEENGQNSQPIDINIRETKPVPVPPAQALKIRDAQVRFMAIDKEMEAARFRLLMAREALIAAVDDAYSAAKVDKAKYKLNEEKWQFEFDPHNTEDAKKAEDKRQQDLAKPGQPLAPEKK